ncbi:CoA-transferase [Chromobacterium sp. LK1]|uniref:CaiB/BaiF CoA transferase family protein n=1 Tax=Chromobacterium sp. LK1 TaxID=1628193 RepID=UPI000653B825|nr:CaiB/BaiF CoA-transferase family protein [Chromobacterium sp. LK1]KMN33031.1 CoA-transferase [Chromobacterium sp. LK1]
MRPLQGMTVLALEHAVAAPFATRQLADLGARVIKVERPGGGDFARAYDERVAGMSSYFAWLNRSKESLTLDLKRPEAAAVLSALLERSDVLVQNLAPGAAARLGLAAAGLRERWPRLIVCDISGYGDNGPYAGRKAYDLLIQAEAGLLSVTGGADGPARAGISVADIAAGMYGYSHILAALLLRERGGAGSHIEVSMLEALTEWMGNPLYFAYRGQPQPERSGASHPSIYPYGPFQAGDGQWLLFGLQNPREWRRFCEQVLQRPELADDPRFAANPRRHQRRAQLQAIIDQVFSGLDSEQLLSRLERAGIGCGRVNAMADVWRHPQLAARRRWRQVDSPAGPIPALLPPGVSDGFDYRMDAIPAPGQHSEAILLELGYAAGDIQGLREQGVI